MCIVTRELNNYLLQCDKQDKLDARIEHEAEKLLKESEFALFHPDTISEAIGDKMDGAAFDHWCELMAKGENEKSVNFLAAFAEIAQLERAERTARELVEKHYNDYDEDDYGF